jgi:hypothetical protein
MKYRTLKALTLVAAIALPCSAMAKADLVVATDAPPKAMNPHAHSSDANFPTCQTFLMACCKEKMANLHRL